MSEALSSTEIEDVLSSIRRLVSDDMRPNGRSGASGVAGGGADKLILTPALRVVAEHASQTTPVFVPHPRPDVASQAVAIEQVVASLGAAMAAQAPEWEPETGDFSPEFADAQPSDDWRLPSAVPSDADENRRPPQALAQDDVPQATAAPLCEDIPGWAQQDDTVSAEEDPGDAAVSGLRGTVEPDPAWADAAEASVIAALSDNLHHATDEGRLPEDDSMVFNEEVLRELVRDILREELAGKMGERITRNIRKLVRAEIARSLAAEKYD